MIDHIKELKIFINRLDVASERNLIAKDTEASILLSALKMRVSQLIADKGLEIKCTCSDSDYMYIENDMKGEFNISTYQEGIGNTEVHIKRKEADSIIKYLQANLASLSE